MSRRIKSPGNFKISHIDQTCKPPTCNTSKQDLTISKRIEMLESLFGLLINNPNRLPHEDQFDLLNKKIDDLENNFQQQINNIQTLEANLEAIIKQLSEHLSQLQTHTVLHNDHSDTLMNHSILHTQHTSMLEDHNTLHTQHTSILDCAFGT